MCYISKKDNLNILLLEHLLLFLNLVLYSLFFVSIVAIFATCVADGNQLMGCASKMNCQKNETIETEKLEDNPMIIKQTKCLHNRIFLERFIEVSAS
jgi:hypothetical protein